MAGLTFERRVSPADPSKTEDLAERLLADVGDADALPLLQMALSQLYEKRIDRPATPGAEHERLLTFRAYQDLGGLHGAIQRRAEAIFSATTPAEQAQLSAVLLALAAGLTETGEVVARPATQVELEIAANPARARLCAALVKGRLLVARPRRRARAVPRGARGAAAAMGAGAGDPEAGAPAGQGEA